MQRRHSVRRLAWRGVVAAISDAMMFSGLYPALPHGWRALSHHDVGERPVLNALIEWALCVVMSAARPLGFLPLPGARTRGPRPVILLHGYAMNRACFLALALRLRAAGLGPIYGFEYWTLGRTAAAARQLGWFVDQVRTATGAAQVDVIGHSMGGVVARYYVTFVGGDGLVRHLITIGSPHAGTEMSRVAIGSITRELLVGSALTIRLAASPPPERTRLTSIWSRGDAMVPASRQRAVSGARTIVYPDLGHVALLWSRKVAAAVIGLLAEPEVEASAPRAAAGS